MNFVVKYVFFLKEHTCNNAIFNYDWCKRKYYDYANSFMENLCAAFKAYLDDLSPNRGIETKMLLKFTEKFIQEKKNKNLQHEYLSKHTRRFFMKIRPR